MAGKECAIGLKKPLRRKKEGKNLHKKKNSTNFALAFSTRVPIPKDKVHDYSGEMAEWSIATVLKTVVPRGTGGSNPSLSATQISSSR